MSNNLKNQEYEARLNTALFKAVLEVSMDPKTKVPVIRNGEVIDASLKLIAMLAATSSETSSPKKAREFTEVLAKQLQNLIAASQKISEKGGMIFFRVL